MHQCRYVIYFAGLPAMVVRLGWLIPNQIRLLWVILLLYVLVKYQSALHWKFTPLVSKVIVNPGEEIVVNYRATNGHIAKHGIGI